MNTKPTEKRNLIEEMIDHAGRLRSEIRRQEERIADLQESEARLRETASIDDAKAISQLSTWRTMRELIPRKIEGLRQELSVIDKELVIAADHIWSEIRKRSRERLESERHRLRLELADVCGRDPARLRAAVEGVLVQSEAARWRSDFPLAALPTVPLQRAKQALRCREFFDAGRTLKSAFRP